MNQPRKVRVRRPRREPYTSIPQGKWPNLFIVGAGKAGTTALWRYLGEHPDIFMSAMKEPRFFAAARSCRSVQDVETYLALFTAARGEKFRGEASPTYLWEKHAPAAIRRVSPRASIVVSLREPVDLTHSLYLSVVREGGERRTFRQAVCDEVRKRTAQSPGTAPPRVGPEEKLLDRPAYLRPALYAPGVERYLDAFGDRVFVLFFEELVADTRGAVRRLCEFLDVDATFADRFDPRPYHQFALPRNGAVRCLLASRGTRRIARAIVPRSLRDPIYEALTPPTRRPEAGSEAVRVLRQVYEPDVAALRALLGRRLPKAWEHRFPLDTSCSREP